MAGPALTDMRLGLVTSGSGRVLHDDGFITAGEVEITLDGPGAAGFAAEIVVACQSHEALAGITRAAMQALRSYQHGNTSPDLAKEIADACDAALEKVAEARS